MIESTSSTNRYLRGRKGVRANWIIDFNYLLPAVVSIQSLRRHLLADCHVHCLERELPLIKGYLEKLVPFASIHLMNDGAGAGHSQHSAVVANREQRFKILREGTGEYLNLLIDADTLFSAGICELLSNLGEHSDDEPMLWGVVEYEEARAAYLFFRKSPSEDGTTDLSPEEKKGAYESIFGSDWETLMRSPQLNNGFLVFQNCTSLADKWREYYRRGLLIKGVNPEDDQVPLAAAIAATTTRLTPLHGMFNSKGLVNGSFAVFHAFAGLWRSEFKAAQRPSIGTSDFAKLALPFLQQIPVELLDSYRLGPGEPFEYLTFPGFFSFESVYWEAVRRIPSGTIVEIGTHRRKSTCFMAELIRSSGKNIRFYSIDIYKRSGSYDELSATFQEKGLSAYVSLLNMRSDEGSALFESQSLDFVFIDRRHDYPALLDDLERWRPKIRRGGALAGDDYTTSHQTESGVRKAVDEFARAHGLSFEVKPPCYMFTF